MLKQSKINKAVQEDTDENSIDITSIFIKIIRLEEKLDSMGSKGDSRQIVLLGWLHTIFLLEIINLLAHWILK